MFRAANKFHKNGNSLKSFYPDMSQSLALIWIPPADCRHEGGCGGSWTRQTAAKELPKLVFQMRIYNLIEIIGNYAEIMQISEQKVLLPIWARAIIWSRNWSLLCPSGVEAPHQPSINTPMPQRRTPHHIKRKYYYCDCFAFRHKIWTIFLAMTRSTFYIIFISLLPTFFLISKAVFYSIKLGRRNNKQKMYIWIK